MAQELGKYGFVPRKCFTARITGGIENNKHTSFKNSYAFMLSDSRAVRAIKLLYGERTLALDRKVRRAYEILDKYEQKELRDGQIEFPHTF